MLMLMLAHRNPISLEVFENGAREKQDHLYICIYIYKEDILQFTQLQLTS